MSLSSVAATSVPDKITIHQLEVQTLIGVYAFELRLKQKLWITVHFHVNAHKISKNDDMSNKNAIDYDHLSQTIVQFGQDKNFYLLETFAEKLAEHLFNLYLPLTWIQLEITKPAALKNAQGVTINICRTSPFQA